MYGKAEAAKMLSEASAAYNDVMFPLFQAERVFGAEETKRVYDEMVANKADPNVTYVCSMWPEDAHEPIPASTPSRSRL